MVTAKIIVLVVSIVMPADQPDVNHVERMADFGSCWKAAREFTERDLTEALRAEGAQGLKATCGYQELPSDTD